MQAKLLLLVEIQYSFCLWYSGKLVESGRRALRLRPASFRELGGWLEFRKPFCLGEERQLLRRRVIKRIPVD